MKPTYELLCHWQQYGRPGGNPLDFDVTRGTTVLGRFESREAAEAEIRRVRAERQNEPRGAHVDEVFDEYEVREVEEP
ncbi:hypothetical protein [Gemmata massiliana]|uniref:hypothetical protein n=1 Tax=Gemmata massiliana TaxID=1210884 RepID=UPI0013A6C422|nr:hypothetical protein [Gemmata massiliana]